MPFPAPKFEDDSPREGVQKGKNTYPMGKKMKKGSKLDCLACRGKNPDCKGCQGKGYIVI